MNHIFSREFLPIDALYPENRRHSKDGREIYRIDHTPYPIAVKRFPNTLSPIDRNRIQSVLKQLDTSGFQNRPGYLTDPRGQYLHATPGGPILVRPWFDRGKMPRTPAQYEALGQSTAALHAIAADPAVPRIPPADSPGERQHMLTLWETLPESPPSQFDYRQCLDAISLPPNLPECLIHNDIGPHNTLIDHTGSLVIIDWDRAGIGPRIFDLAFPLIWMFIDADCRLEDANAEAFYGGYRAVEDVPPLSAGETEHLFPAALFFALKYMFYRNPSINIARIKTAIRARHRMEQWFHNL